MNRIQLSIIKQNTTPPLQQLDQILTCSPYCSGWMSEKFPIFPIIINLHAANPPFNKISISLHRQYLPSKLKMYGSADAQEYFKIWEIKQFQAVNTECLMVNFDETHYYKYLRVIIEAPHQSQTNICKQICIRCIQVTHITIYGAEYACSMKSALKYDPYLFRILQLLEYKSLLLKKKDVQASAKYTNKIDKLFQQLKIKKQNQAKLSEKTRQQLIQQIKQIMDQPFESLHGQEIEYDRQSIKKQVKMLQGQLSEFYVYRLKFLHKDVTDYFERYWNVQIKEQYLRLLSSPERQDHGKALSTFWAEVKQLQQCPPNIEEAAVMFFNYFLEYVHDPLKITAIKIMCLFFRNPSLSFKIYNVYQRVLFNLYTQLGDPQNQGLYGTSLKCIYTLFQKVPDKLFLQALLNSEHSIKHNMKLAKLQILQKLTFKNITIQDKQPVYDFLLDMLLQKNLTLPTKNRAYNIIAYLASLVGKQAVMARFQKLNTMLLMPMEKIVDKKLEMIRMPKKSEQLAGCDYCGIVREAFRDQNVLDLHCVKQCRYLTPCKYCSQVVEIPQLFKHYIHDCKQRNIFKECEDCNETIHKDKQNEHKKRCTKLLATKCPLCFEKMDGKLKLKQHILKDGCPNNNR